MPDLIRYTALALQTRCDAINRCSGREEARAVMQQSLARIGAQIRASKTFIGDDVRLVVLPEYFLTGFPMQESIEAWQEKACLEMRDAIYDQLGEIAQSARVYIAGNAYELDANFPNLYFQTSFLINDSGALMLRYRRLISMFAPTPHDVWDRYLDVYGLDGVFPVADTELGRISAIASEEILYPEIARAHALQGAEILVHSTSEVGTPMASPKHVAKQARAYENMVYVISSNSAGIADTPIPSQSTDGMSAVFDYKGLKLIEAGFGESMVAFASVDLGALRAWRARPGMGNILSRQRTELFAPIYAKHTLHPANTLLDKKPTRAHFAQVQRAVLERMKLVTESLQGPARDLTRS
jgi:predicted amidohydrolase